MCLLAASRERLAAIPDARLLENAPLANYTRFAIGGPAALLFDTAHEAPFLDALTAVIGLAVPYVVIGGGTNLIVSDAGFCGVVLHYTGSAIKQDDAHLRVQSGAVLQQVVDGSIALGLRGLETMTGIPGYLGGAVYGNAGAYGHSIQELVRCVRVFNGSQISEMTNAECGFRYRTSILKENKSWIILSADLAFRDGESTELAATAREIRSIRDAKYPPEMRCAGSIFKNLLFADLPAQAAEQVPPRLIREGKVPSAWFLEETGVKGMRRGDIQVAQYHANLIYNDGAGTAEDLIALIAELKHRVQRRFGFELEEEVQYVGCNGAGNF